MVWPILISVSLAPESYFFCASEGAASARPSAVTARVVLIDMMALLSLVRQSRRCVVLPGSFEFGPGKTQCAGHAGRHHVHEQDHESAVDQPRRGLGNLVGDVGHELHEQRAVQRAGD